MPIDDPEYWLEKAIARQGSRNDRAVWLAVQLRDNRVDQNLAESTLREFASFVNDEKREPYRESEALSTCRSVYRDPPREPATGKGETTEGDRERLRKVQKQDERYRAIAGSADWEGALSRIRLSESIESESSLETASMETIIREVDRAGDRKEEALSILVDRVIVLLRVFSAYRNLHPEEFENVILQGLQHEPDDLFERIGIDRDTYTWER